MFRIVGNKIHVIVDSKRGLIFLIFNIWLSFFEDIFSERNLIFDPLKITINS